MLNFTLPNFLFVHVDFCGSVDDAAWLNTLQLYTSLYKHALLYCMCLYTQLLRLACMQYLFQSCYGYRGCPKISVPSALQLQTFTLQICLLSHAIIIANLQDKHWLHGQLTIAIAIVSGFMFYDGMQASIQLMLAICFWYKNYPQNMTQLQLALTVMKYVLFKSSMIFVRQQQLGLTSLMLL